MSNPPDPTSGSGRDASTGREEGGPRARGRLDERCAALVKQLRERCPGVLPEDPLPAGTPAKPVPVEPREYEALLQVAARQAAALAASGRLPGSDDELPQVVLWEEADSALAVGVASIQIAVEDGEITVGIPVFCDQVRRRDVVRVTFVVGTTERPTGLLAATTRAPVGPAPVVAAWGEPLTALAWQALLDVAAGVAAQAGADTDGTPLAVTALTAARDRVEILPQARHAFDRRPPTRAVTG